MKLDGIKLRRIREDKGLTQYDVIDMVAANGKELTVGTISNAEHGKSISIKTAKKICDALLVEIADIRLPLERNDDTRKGVRSSGPRSRGKGNMSHSSSVRKAS